MAHKFLTRLYRGASSPIGRLRLRAALRDGLPPALARPFRYLFDRRVSGTDQAIVKGIESLRAQIALHNEIFDVVSPSNLGQMNPIRNGRWIAYRSSIARDWGTFLYLCARELEPETVLELGSCAGISGSYLAAAPSVKKLITVEGSAPLATMARSNIETVSDRAIVMNCLFDDALDRLPEMVDKLDLVFIDGQHTRAARLHYMSRVEPYLRPGSVVIFDDIHLSEELWRAWHELRRWPGVSHSINSGRLGICVWAGGNASARNYDFAAITGCLRIGGTRWKWREYSRFAADTTPPTGSDKWESEILASTRTSPGPPTSQNQC